MKIAGKKIGRGWLFLFGVVALACSLPIGLLLVVFIPPTYESLAATGFEPQAWQRGSQVERGRMHEDLLSSRRLIGKSRVEVIELLGPPSHVGENDVSYAIDIGLRFGSDPWLYLLHIEFDNNGRVEAAWIHD